MPSKLIALVLVSTCMLAACVPPDLMSSVNNPPGSDATQDTESDLSGTGQFAQVAQVLTANCAIDTCHNGSSSFLPRIEGGTSATLAQVKTALDGIDGPLGMLPLVTANDLDGSLLWIRMSSDAQPMPAVGKLPEDQLNIIKSWIEAGAPYDVGTTPGADMGPDLSDSTPDEASDQGADEAMDAVEDEGTAGPTKFSEIAPMLASTCGGCHIAGYANLPNFADGTGSTVAQVRTALEGIDSRKIPGTALTTVIYDRLRGMNGAVMPIGAMWAQSDIDKYASWLNAGANYDD